MKKISNQEKRVIILEIVDHLKKLTSTWSRWFKTIKIYPRLLYVDQTKKQIGGPHTTVSAFPPAKDRSKVGTYPLLTFSGGGYFYDTVLEYRVWVRAEEGEVLMHAFASFQEAEDFSKNTPGAEPVLVLVSQNEHINEPDGGGYEHVKEYRITEWIPEWLIDSQNTKKRIPLFLKEKNDSILHLENYAVIWEDWLDYDKGLSRFAVSKWPTNYAEIMDRTIQEFCGVLSLQVQSYLVTERTTAAITDDQSVEFLLKSYGGSAANHPFIFVGNNLESADLGSFLETTWAKEETYAYLPSQVSLCHGPSNLDGDEWYIIVKKEFEGEFLSILKSNQERYKFKCIYEKATD